MSYDGPLMTGAPRPGRHRKPPTGWSALLLALLVAALLALVAGYCAGYWLDL